MNAGNKGNIKYISFCAIIISVIFNDPAHNITDIIINPIDTSYDIICAAALIAPKNAYFELLAHPDINIAYTPIDPTANIYSIPTFISANIAPSEYGITAHDINDNINPNNGAIININLFE
jgi:hypothetical protein